MCSTAEKAIFLAIKLHLSEKSASGQACSALLQMFVDLWLMDQR